MVSQSVSTNPDVCLNVGEPLPLSPLVTAALEVTTVGSLAAPSSSGPALSPRTSHLASVPSSPVFANQSPVGLAALNSSMAVDLQDPSRSERVSQSVEAACSEETVEAVRSVHAPGSMPAPSTQTGSLSASSAQANSMQDGDSGATVTTGQAAVVTPLRRSNRQRRSNPKYFGDKFVNLTTSHPIPLSVEPRTVAQADYSYYSDHYEDREHMMQPYEEENKENMRNKILAMLEELKQDITHFRQEWKQELRQEISSLRKETFSIRQETQASIWNFEEQMARWAKCGNEGEITCAECFGSREADRGRDVVAGLLCPLSIPPRSSFSTVGPVRMRDVVCLLLVDRTLVV
nr:vegetative cell wall protein gp1-like [Ipomoea batatas]